MLPLLRQWQLVKHSNINSLCASLAFTWILLFSTFSIAIFMFSRALDDVVDFLFNPNYSSVSAILRWRAVAEKNGKNYWSDEQKWAKVTLAYNFNVYQSRQTILWVHFSLNPMKIHCGSDFMHKNKWRLIFFELNDQLNWVNPVSSTTSRHYWVPPSLSLPSCAALSRFKFRLCENLHFICSLRFRVNEIRSEHRKSTTQTDESVRWFEL